MATTKTKKNRKIKRTSSSARPVKARVLRAAASKQQIQDAPSPRVNRIQVKVVAGAEPKVLRNMRTVNQFSYMKAPGPEYAFEVGDTVEVFCDHEKNNDRVRGWVKGIVVQVDNKMVAVQFRSNVFLTDGWMVPDRILWYPVNSEHIRPASVKKPLKKERIIPGY